MPLPAVSPTGRLSTAWLLVLAFLATTSPLATDLYLPGFPRVQQEFSSGASEVQLTMTAFLLGTAFGQLTFGTLSDRFGRFRPLLAGTAGALLASVLAAIAPSIEFLLLARLLQGLCGAAGIVIARAIIVDLTRGAETARTMSVMMTLGGVAPVLAPSIGALLVEPIGWRGVMWVLAALFALMLIAVGSVLRETRPVRADGAPGLLGGLARLRHESAYLGFAAVYALTFAAMMAYVSASPFVYQNVIGLSPLGYGLAFGGNAVGLIAAGWVSGRLAGSVGPVAILRVATPALPGFCLLLLILALSPAPRILLAVPLWCAITTVGFIMGNAAVLALAQVRGISGSGSAGLGFVQFVLGALASPLSGIAGEGTAVPMAVLMAGLSLFGAGMFLVARRQKQAD